MLFTSIIEPFKSNGVKSVFYVLNRAGEHVFTLGQCTAQQNVRSFVISNSAGHGLMTFTTKGLLVWNPWDAYTNYVMLEVFHQFLLNFWTVFTPYHSPNNIKILLHVTEQGLWRWRSGFVELYTNTTLPRWLHFTRSIQGSSENSLWLYTILWVLSCSFFICNDVHYRFRWDQ